MRIFQCIILMCFIHSNFGWIRFRYPMSRRNFLQQTAREMLQNCGGNSEELCGVCGEGPNELPTELISTKDFQLVNTSEGPLEIRLGFRMNMQGFFEMRLCKLGPDSLVNADYCRNVAPLKLFDDYRYIPGNEQNSARLQITLPPEAVCERSVLQVKYVPGAGSRVADQLFFDCALLRIPRSRENLKLTGRIVMSTDKPLNTSPFAPQFQTESSSIGSSISPVISVTTTVAPARFSDLPSSTLSVGTTPLASGMLTGATPTKAILKTTGFPTNTFPSSGQSSISSIYLNNPLPTLSNSGKFITIITKPVSSTTSVNRDRRFGTIRNSMDFQKVLNSNTRTTDTLSIPNRPIVGLEQLGPEPSDPFLEPRTSDIPFTTVPTGIDMNNTIIINETSTNTRSSIVISVKNVTAGYTNPTDVFDANQTDFISIENDTVVISGNISDTISTGGIMNDTLLFNQTESNIRLTEIPLPGEVSTITLNENQTIIQNVTDNPSRTVIGNYDTYDYNNTYTDYYYDYFTYSDVPLTKNNTSKEKNIDNNNDTFPKFNESTTYIEFLNETVSTDLFTNETLINVTTPETQTLTNQADILNVTRLEPLVNNTETTDPYIYYYDYEIVTNDSTVVDNFTITVTDMNNTTSLINSTFTLDTISTTNVPEVITEIPLPETTNTSINDTIQTTNIMPGINATLTEIPLNVATATDSQINDTVPGTPTAEPDQKIVVVSDSLFDRVLFPTPKPNQRVVEVPNVITIFPTKDSIFPDTTTPSQMTTMSTSSVQQTTGVTDMLTKRATRPVTEITVEAINTPETTQNIPIVNITEMDYVNQTEVVLDPYEVTTPETVLSSTKVPFTQPTSEILSTIDPIFETNTTQADYITNITTNTVTFGTDSGQSTTKDTQTIIDTTNFDKASTFASEQTINATFKPFESTPTSRSTTLMNDYRKIITDPGTTMPEIRWDTTSLNSGITEKNLGIDLILDKQTRPGNVDPFADNVKIAVDPITQPRTTPSSTFGQFQGGITYMPEVDGQADTRGGIPIQPGMFIDLFIPKFNPDSKDNMFLQKVNSSNILTHVLPGDDQKGSITGAMQERNQRVFSEIPIRPRPSTPDETPRAILNERGASTGQFSRISSPTSTNVRVGATRRRFNVNNGKSEQGSTSNRESNFTPVQNIDNKLIDRSLNGKTIFTSNTIDKSIGVLPVTGKETSSVRKGESRDLFFNLLESPEIMPPIFVPKGAAKANEEAIIKQDKDNRVISSNTVWKGPGVGQGFGLFTGPVRFQGLEQNTDSLKKESNFIGVTGPVYVPVNEVSIPLNGRSESEERKSKGFNSGENPAYNEINTTFSTLWDLNRLNRNKNQESGTFVNMETSQDLMPPYIGIPLVWSQENSAGSKVERTTKPNEKNWNDLPVPDIMPPIKVRLLNMTSKGTFVDNNSKLNQTDDVNKRILQKLEAIVGELQRNRAILTQSLDVNPAYEQGFQLSFDRFPGQFSRLTDSRNNQVGLQAVNTPRTNLLSEIIQEPVLIQRIGSAGNSAEKSSSNMFPKYVNDPRGSAPISEAHIGSVVGPHSFNLMNMLGITDMRPLKQGDTGIRININTSETGLDSLSTNQTVIDTGIMGNDTMTMLSNTLKAILSNQSFENVTLMDEITPTDPILRMDNISTEEGSMFGRNTTEPLSETIKTTEQTIVDVQNMSRMLQALSTKSNNLPKVTNNNQLVISPTVSELLNPFLGTNISLENRTESVDDNTTLRNDSIELNNETEKTISPTASASTTSGQSVISGVETVAMINELNKRKVNQRDMTDKERVRDKFVRLTFNNRVKGIRLHPSKRISIKGKYYVGKMHENTLGEFEPVPVNSGVILHEVTPRRKSESIQNQSDLPIVQLSEFNISPVNKQTETATNENGLPRVTNSQIVQIQTLQSDVERRNIETNQQLGMTQGNLASIQNIEKATPIITKQFFDGSDILMARAKSMESRDSLSQMGDGSSYGTHGLSLSASTQRAQSNANNVNPLTTDSNDIDLFSGKYRHRLPNSLSLSPVAPSNMCPEGQLFVCKAVEDYSMVPGMRWWCFSHCRLGNCPDKKCQCTCEANQPYTIKSQTDTINETPNEITNTVEKAQTAEFSGGQNMFREKTIINLTLNGSELSKVVLPIENQVTQNALGNKMGKLVITKYGRSDSINEHEVPVLASGQNQNLGSSLSQKVEISPLNTVDNIPHQDLSEIRRISSTAANALSNRDSLNCKGINAFAGKPEIDRWCTINCNRNVCPQELCIC